MSSISISKDTNKLDVNLINDFLSLTYWAKGRSRSSVVTTIENSICFGMYDKNSQIGFGRLVSDKCVFAYIMDVFILRDYRGNGYGKMLMAYIMDDKNLQKVEKWLMATQMHMVCIRNMAL